MLIKEIPKRAFVKIQKTETVPKVLSKIRRANDRTALIFDGNKYLGVLSKLALLRSNRPHEMKISNALKRVGTITNQASLLEAAYQMTNMDTFIIPVEKRGKIVGVLHVFELIAHLKSFKEIRGAAIKDLRITKVIPLGEDAKVTQALTQMHQLHHYSVPVVDKQGFLAGVVSANDILHALATPPSKAGRMSSKGRGGKPSSRGFTANRPSLMNLNLKSFISRRDSVTAKSDEKVFTVANRMIKKDVLSAVITRDKRPVGMLTANSIVRLLASLFKKERLNIGLTGIKKTDLSAFEQKQLAKVTSQQVRLIERLLNTDNLICNVHVKVYRKKGSKPKYSVHVNLFYPGSHLASSEDDWDFNTAFRKTFNNIKKQIKHKFKSGSLRKKT